MGFDTTDLLREQGYQKGDVLLLTSVPVTQDRRVSTTSTSFVTQPDTIDFLVDFDRIAPSDATLVASLSVKFEPGTGETMSGRVRDIVSGVDISPTATAPQGTSTVETTNFIAFTPNSGTRQVFYQHKVDTGSNSSTSQAPTLHIGIQL